MSGVSTDGGAGQAEIDAALLRLSRMGIRPADLLGTAVVRGPSPTFAEYVPVVSAAVTHASRKAYESHWNRVVQPWGARRLDEPTPSEVQALAEQLREAVVVRVKDRRQEFGSSQQGGLVRLASGASTPSRPYSSS